MPIYSLAESLLVYVFVDLNNFIEFDALILALSNTLWIDELAYRVFDTIWMHFTSPINGTHDHLVNMTANQQVGFLTESYSHNTPNYLGHFISYSEFSTQSPESLRRNFTHPSEKLIKRKHVLLLLLLSHCQVSQSHLTFYV